MRVRPVLVSEGRSWRTFGQDFVRFLSINDLAFLKTQKIGKKFSFLRPPPLLGARWGLRRLDFREVLV